MKYEGPNSYQSKDMANEKAFADKQIDKWTDEQTDKQTGQKLYAPDLLIGGGGHKKENFISFFYFIKHVYNGHQNKSLLMAIEAITSSSKARFVTANKYNKK